ncbi:shikimate dehydrogenase family protein [Rhodococcus opacus]|uniref:shikimate dehydrogenase family protein n=1 Tax=Rhodococcus opacus TaxID=37919 RepID=UPI001C481CFC|nr:shikimate dehydrogenase [Rhodococcus opacus]MBV6760244.1 shikimate dehydrogenase [Rhodococcus opacus]
MTHRLSGNTKFFGVIGDPIAQARAPEVWNALFALNGVDAVCVPLQVGPDRLTDFLTGCRALKNLHGLLVTIPHKPAALASVQHPTDRAAQVGVVNVLKLTETGEWTGDILDGVGFVNGLESKGHGLQGMRALVVGSGGVGAAIAFAIADAGAKEIVVADILAGRAQDLADRISTTGVPSTVGAAAAAGFDVVVNASPVGMKTTDSLPVDCAGLSPSTIVADAVMHPRMTQLLSLAADRGCVVEPGFNMMDNQLAPMAEFFGFGPGDWSPQAAVRLG